MPPSDPFAPCPLFDPRIILVPGTTATAATSDPARSLGSVRRGCRERRKPRRTCVADGRQRAPPTLWDSQPERRSAQQILICQAFARARFARPIRVSSGAAGSGARWIVYHAPDGTFALRTYMRVCTSPILYRLGGVLPFRPCPCATRLRSLLRVAYMWDCVGSARVIGVPQLNILDLT